MAFILRLQPLFFHLIGNYAFLNKEPIWSSYRILWGIHIFIKNYKYLYKNNKNLAFNNFNSF